MESNYFTPTKESPAFIAECSVFGYIETGIYKNIKIETGDNEYSTMYCFAMNYIEAIASLHIWIKESKDFVLENPKAKFTISYVNGSFKVRKYDTIINAKKIYEITGANAKLLLF